MGPWDSCIKEQGKRQQQSRAEVKIRRAEIEIQIKSKRIHKLCN